MKSDSPGKPKISAYDALYEAQKIAFAPVIFQVACALCDLGILREVEKSGKAGVSALKISDVLKISRYGVETLLESGQSFNIVDFHGDVYRDRRYFITKIGFYLLNDTMTRINLEFINHICYKGMAELSQSVLEEKPKGLEVFGRHWGTIYEALPGLTQETKTCWDRFDHFYSDAAYPHALPIVFMHKPRTLVDVGANNGEFSILVAQFAPEISVYMVDLQEQLEIALKNVESKDMTEQISCWPANMLAGNARLPRGADVYWMSQFLSCFSATKITEILGLVRDSMTDSSRVFVLETCWDRQKHEASAFSLVNTSPYFTCMANGNSKMYHSDELTEHITNAGLLVVSVHDHLGICHTLFECVKA